MKISNAMAAFPDFNSKKNSPFRGSGELRYWLVWAVVIGLLAYGIHRYFEYRNRELDRRLEQLR